MKKNLVEEILKNASEIPLEYQEKILENMKAMILLKEWFWKNKKINIIKQAREEILEWII